MWEELVDRVSLKPVESCYAVGDCLEIQKKVTTRYYSHAQEVKIKIR